MSGVQRAREMVAKAVHLQSKIFLGDIVDCNDLVEFQSRRDIDKTLFVFTPFKARGLQDQNPRLHLRAQAQLFVTIDHASIRCRAPHFVYGWPARRRHGVLQKSKVMSMSQ